MALSVVLAVGDKTADDLCARLKNRSPRCASGRAWTSRRKTKMGPLISAHRSKVLGYIDSGEAQERNCGRSRLQREGPRAGYFVGPTLFDNVTPEMTIYKEEIFGPVLSVVRVAGYASAVDLINRQRIW